MATPDAGYRQVEHTADMALELWAPTVAELFGVGARAIGELLTDDAPADGGDTLAVAVDAENRETLLVVWLNELLYRALVDGFIPTDADVDLRERDLTATLRGQANGAERVATELKSVTYHDLWLRAEDGGQRWRAHVVIDV